jgi:hypothetical protein
VTAFDPKADTFREAQRSPHHSKQRILSPRRRHTVTAIRRIVREGLQLSSLERHGSWEARGKGNDMPKAKKKTAATNKATNIVELELKYSGGLQFKKALVNRVKLAFSGGVAGFGVQEGTDHVLTWEVVGFVGTKWSFKLTTDADGYEIKPKKLSDPGESMELEETTEKHDFTFSVVKKKEEAA